MTTRVERIPFREFLTKTMAIVFDPAIVLFCIFTSALMAAGLSFARTGLLIVPGMILLLFATSAFMKYATMVTRAVTLGKTAPSADSAVFEYFSSAWAFSPWLVLVIFNLLALAVWQHLGNAALVVLLLVTLPLVPAAIAVTSVNCRPWIMLHVPGLLKVIRILGLDYLKILLGWALLGLLAAILRSNGALFFSMLALFVGCIQILFVFVSTGVVLFHHREPLGIPIEKDTREARSAAYEHANVIKERRTALDQAYVFFSRDNSLGGMQRLQSFFDNHAHDVDAWPWFVDEMSGWESTQPMLMLARNYFAHLLEAQRDDEARELLLRCLRIAPQFAPHAQHRAAARQLLQGYPEAELAQRWR